MKNFIMAFWLAVPTLVFAQQGSYLIKGQVGTLSAPAKLYLIYNSGDTNIVDSIFLNEGSFEFKGKIADPVKAKLILKHQGKPSILDIEDDNADKLDFYLEKGLTRIKSPDSISKADVSGSITNDYNKKFQESLSEVKLKRRAMEAAYQAASPEKRSSSEFHEERVRQTFAIVGEEKQQMLTFIKDNPSTIVSLDLLQSYGGSFPDLAVVVPLYNSLTPEVKNSARGKQYAATLEKIKKTDIGAIAPLFEQKNPAGKPVKLEDFRGKYVLIDFWASWCGPCRAENPHLVDAYKKFKDKGFTILSVSLDSERGRAAWLKAIKADNLTWTQVSDLKYWKNAAALLYAVYAIPQNFLVNPQGIIVGKNLKGEALDKKLKELL